MNIMKKKNSDWKKTSSGGKVKNDKGWRRRPDGRIESSRGMLCCPVCGLPIHKLLPETEARQFVIYCKRCHKESIVDISSVPVP